MKDIRYWKEVQKNPKELESHYDYSNPNNYWESVFIQNDKK